MKRALIILLSVLCLFGFVGCDSGEQSTSANNAELAKEMVTVVDNTVIITVDSDYFTVKEDTVLLDYMQALKADGAIDFAINDGMVSAINGQENPADWSRCWMLYTNDTELSNEAWGTVEVVGITYFSAVLGAEELPIKDGKTYVWEFKSF